MTIESEAELDPWCLVVLDDGRRILFGYALRHPVTAGLAWTVTSEVLELDRARGSAATSSGRSYRLGREFQALDVRTEGVEAGLAFELLLERQVRLLAALHAIDRRWLEACKAARHLGMAVPRYTAKAVRRFMEDHSERYLEVRRKRDGGSGLVH